MNARLKTEQEVFWEGEFGREYTSRNQALYDSYQGRDDFFADILSRLDNARSVCEFGANAGQNLQVLRRLDDRLTLTGVEINEAACGEMNRLEGIHGVHSSIQDYRADTAHDLVFTCGVLIHVNPDDLEDVYRKMVSTSSRYVLINEYYNPHPTEIDYRGHTGKLFKRDFAGELLDTCPEVSVKGYGFLWNRLHPSWDNTTWVLMEKR